MYPVSPLTLALRMVVTAAFVVTLSLALATCAGVIWDWGETGYGSDSPHGEAGLFTRFEPRAPVPPSFETLTSGWRPGCYFGRFAFSA